MKWEDVTTYSRGGGNQPDTWEIRHGKMRICVTRGHIYYRPEWVMHCQALHMDTIPLQKGLNQEQAETEALRLVQERLDTLVADFQACLQGAA